MRAALMGTTAVALIGATALPADAAEWTMRVGGYMEQYAAYADVDADFEANTGDDANDKPFIRGDGDFDGIDSKNEGEIWFLPRITLDNGIEIGANVQLENLTGGDQIDESFMQIQGGFGEVLLGSENSAGYKMTYAAPDVTFLNVNSGSLTFFVPWSGTGVGADTFRRTLGTSFIENEGVNDAQRFTYFTPRFAGLQVGASYARDGNQDDNSQVDEDKELSDIVDIGANYVNSFGGIDVAVSGRWGTADAPEGDSSDPDLWSVGANLGYSFGGGTITVGGSYAEQNDAETENGEFWDAGIAYETGPWGFSFAYSQGDNEDDDGTTQEEELEQYLGGISYALAKGVKLNAFGAYVDFDNPEGGDNVGDVDAWVAGTAIRIDF